MLSNRPVSHNAIRRVSFHYFDCKDVNFQLIILGHGRYSQGSVLIQKFYQMFKDVDVARNSVPFRRMRNERICGRSHLPDCLARFSAPQNKNFLRRAP